jgi:glutamate-1-semialdehyde 2,1-aminomutase
MAMILGHAHPAVMEAIKRQAEKGWHYGFAHELEVAHSEAIARNVPSAELVRHTSSGSEANFFAVRLARTFTGRTKIAKFEGGWQGAYDPLHLAIKPPFNSPVSGGITRGSQEDTIVVPFNDLEGFKDRVKNERLACVVLEPVLFAGGCIPADREFVKAMREYCDETDTLLVFDEIITGFRLGLSGAQGFYRVEPDLTVLGKIVGGGLPIGVICGSREVMERMDHTKYAGLATINELEHSPVYEHIDRLGEKVREETKGVFTDADFPAQTVGVGSMFCIHMIRNTPIKDARGHDHYEITQCKKLFNFLLENGIIILLPETLHGGISYAHTEEDVNRLVSIIRDYAKLT